MISTAAPRITCFRSIGKIDIPLHPGGSTIVRLVKIMVTALAVAMAMTLAAAGAVAQTETPTEGVVITEPWPASKLIRYFCMQPVNFDEYDIEDQNDDLKELKEDKKVVSDYPNFSKTARFVSGKYANKAFDRVESFDDIKEHDRRWYDEEMRLESSEYSPKPYNQQGTPGKQARSDLYQASDLSKETLPRICDDFVRYSRHKNWVLSKWTEHEDIKACCSTEDGMGDFLGNLLCEKTLNSALDLALQRKLPDPTLDMQKCRKAYVDKTIRLSDGKMDHYYDIAGEKDEVQAEMELLKKGSDAPPAG